MASLLETEEQLKKRLDYPYKWGRRQNDEYDKATNFIYSTFGFDALIDKINKEFASNSNFDEFKNYALNRWFNYWSARGIEDIFCSLPGVEPSLNPRNRLIDFYIDGVNFDHKTSVFPKAFGKQLNEALEDPSDLIRWLYENQSQQQRKHLKNRLFMVLYSNDNEHWRLKAQLSWLKTIVEAYVNIFNKEKLYKFEFEPNEETLSDIIWAIK